MRTTTNPLSGTCFPDEHADQVLLASLSTTDPRLLSRLANNAYDFDLQTLLLLNPSTPQDAKDNLINDGYGENYEFRYLPASYLVRFVEQHLPLPYLTNDEFVKYRLQQHELMRTQERLGDLPDSWLDRAVFGYDFNR